ncbi:PKD domain-containing protein [Halosimplex amylolyticum]|uniref:PKD domain-containing protein n=1 Tax=Halosimplex amylolyticum TaxID=3396616 RepID=UPI003F576DAA
MAPDFERSAAGLEPQTIQDNETGVSVTFSRSAIDRENVSITPYPERGEHDLSNAGPVVRITSTERPTGTTTVSVPLSDSVAAAEFGNLSIYHWDGTARGWRPVATSIDENERRASATVPSLGYFAVLNETAWNESTRVRRPEPIAPADPGGVYVGTENGTLRKVAVDSGQTVWVRSLGAPGDTAVAADPEGAIYAAVNRSRAVRQLDWVDGSVTSSVPFERGAVELSTTRAGTVFAAANGAIGGNLTRIDAERGFRPWTLIHFSRHASDYNVDDFTHGSDGALYVGLYLESRREPARLVRLNQTALENPYGANGSQRDFTVWERDIDARFVNDVTQLGAGVYAAISNGVRRVSATDGSAGWTTAVDGGVSELAVGQNGTIYAAADTDDDTKPFVLQLDPTTGQVRENTTVPLHERATITDLTVGPNGTVYVGSRTGAVYDPGATEQTATSRNNTASGSNTTARSGPSERAVGDLRASDDRGAATALESDAPLGIDVDPPAGSSTVIDTTRLVPGLEQFGGGSPSARAGASLSITANRTSITAGDDLTLRFSASSRTNATLTIETADGAVVLQRPVTAYPQTTALTVSNMQSGSYVARIAADSGPLNDSTERITVTEPGSDEPAPLTIEAVNRSIATDESLRLRYAAGNETDATITLETTDGTDVLRQSVTATTRPAELSVSNLDAGTYVARIAADSDGRSNATATITVSEPSTGSRNLTVRAVDRNLTTEETLVLEFSADRRTNATLYVNATDGRVLLDRSVTAGQQPTQLSVPDLPAGTYVAAIESTDGSHGGSTQVITVSEPSGSGSANLSLAAVDRTLTTGEDLVLRYSADEQTNAWITLTTSSGQTVLNTSVTATERQSKLTIPNPPAGTYVAAIESETGDGRATAETITVSRPDDGGPTSLSLRAVQRNLTTEQNLTLAYSADASTSGQLRLETASGRVLLNTSVGVSERESRLTIPGLGAGEYVAVLTAAGGNLTARTGTITVESERGPTLNVTAPPNEFTRSEPLRLRLESDAGRNVTISVATLDGDVVYRSTASVPGGQMTYRLRGIPAGEYVVTVRAPAANLTATTDPVTVRVVEPQMSASPSASGPGEPITFTAATNDSGHTGTIVETVWEFGDGTTETVRGAQVAHSYSEPGEYDVTVTIVDAFGGRTNHTVTTTVTVADPANLTDPKGTVTALSPNGSVAWQRETDSGVTALAETGGVEPARNPEGETRPVWSIDVPEENSTTVSAVVRATGPANATATLVARANGVTETESVATGDRRVVAVPVGAFAGQEITVTARSPDNVSVAVSDVRLYRDDDGDYLPNYIEETEYTLPIGRAPTVSTDPQQADTDGDGLGDGHEVLFRLTNGSVRDTTLTPARIDGHPLRADADGDSLNDTIESTYPWLNSFQADSDGDGVPDAAEDRDGDGLSIADEYAHGTSPLVADTDRDGLSDRAEVRSHSTDPTLKDTDADGLADSDEVVLPADPRDPDTDGDGTLDGNETYTTTTGNESLGATVSITGEGNVAAQTTVEEPRHVRYQDEYTPNASVAPFVEFESRANFSRANITIAYNESRVESSEGNLSIYRFNESAQRYEHVNSTVDPESNTVTATTEHFSTYTVFDNQEWTEFLHHRNDILSWRPNGSTGEGIANWTFQSMPSSIDESDWSCNVEDRGSGYHDQPADGGCAIDSDDDAIRVWENTTRERFLNRTTTLPEEGPLFVKIKATAHIQSVWSHAAAVLSLDSGNNETDIYRLESDSSMVSDTRTVVRRLNVTEYAGENVTVSLRADARHTTGDHSWLRAHFIDFEAPAESVVDRDSDGDGIPDFREVKGIPLANGPVVKLDPYDADTDGDGIPDGEEIDVTSRITQEPPRSKALETGYQWSSNPAPGNRDSDGDGLTDAQEADGWTISVLDTHDDALAFSEAIGTKDGEPGQYVTDRTVTSDPLYKDTDDDGLDDDREERLGTDPWSEDTDNDGQADDEELEDGHDPTLFDINGPTLDIHSAGYGSRLPWTPGYKSFYYVEGSADDPSGVESSTIIVDGKEYSNSDPGYFNREIDAGALGTFEEALAKTKLKVRATDEHGNSRTTLAAARHNGLVEAVKQSGTLGSLSESQAFALGTGTGISSGAGRLTGTVQDVVNRPQQTLNRYSNLSRYEQLIENVDDIPGLLVTQYQRQQRTANPYYRKGEIANQELYDDFRRGYYAGLVVFEVAQSAATGQVKKIDKVQKLADKTGANRALKYYRSTRSKYVTGPAVMVGSKVTRRVVSKVDVGASDTIRKTLSEVETVGRTWSLSRRLGNTPSGVLTGLSDTGRAQLRTYYRRIRGSGSDGGDTGLEVLTDGGQERFVDTLEDVEKGGQRAAMLQRKLDESDFGAVFNADLPDETRGTLLRAYDDGDLSASETATVARKLDEPGNSDVVSTIRTLDETDQRRALKLVADAGDSGVTLVRDLDSASLQRLFRLEDRGDWIGLDGRFDDWDLWRADIAGALGDSRVDTDDVEAYLSDLDEIVDATRNGDVDVENYRALVDETSPNGNSFLNLANEADRTRAYVRGESDFIPDGRDVDEVVVEPQFTTTSKDVDMKVQYGDGSADYVEFKRVSGKDFRGNIFDNVIDDSRDADSMNRKFIEIRSETSDGSNSGEITVDYDQYGIDSNSEFEQRLLDEIDRNLKNNIVDKIVVDRVRVNPDDAEPFTVDLSQVGE